MTTKPSIDVSKCPFCTNIIWDIYGINTQPSIKEWRLDHDNGHPSETNEAPVESVSQPKAVDGYLKEFDERYKLSLVRSLQQHIYKKPANYHDRKHNEVIGQLVYKVEHLNLLPEMKSLWESSIERARREAVKEYRLNNPRPQRAHCKVCQVDIDVDTGERTK